MMKEFDDADSCEYCARSEKAQYRAAESSGEPVVVLVVRGVVNGSRNKTSSTSDHRARNHPALRIWQIRPADVDNPLDVRPAELF